MTETYKKISFEKVRSIIEKILGCSIKDKLELDPDEIHRLAENNGIKLNWKPIENWTKFEYGQVDIDEKDFLEIIFKNIKPVGQIAIVTDKCFREKEAYLVDGKNLENFISNIYPDIHDIDFFQPEDFIFVCPEISMITVLHHEGKIMQFERKNE